ncbi:hypothetical protein [Enterobacter asburiae]|uniref:hypothetical protein n=1 Tax=Enterobacter cloacae complex TaxID=354276 RepID=UPI000649F18F|nr:hypothetical protein [Enterobacter asburiae]KLP59379.1 hypothetical protein ABF83_22945 [Enterobacter asburiae]KUQ23598.1 hypothetical protein AWI12_18850 [Enterobacter asburiae]
MTLEQRVEALEMAIANMSVQQSGTEEIAEIAQKVTAEVIASAQLPGGVLNAAQKQAAEKQATFYAASFGVVD